MNACCEHLIKRGKEELAAKDKRIAFLESECTRLFDPTRELWNQERQSELQSTKEALRIATEALQYIGSNLAMDMDDAYARKALRKLQSMQLNMTYVTLCVT